VPDGRDNAGIDDVPDGVGSAYQLRSQGDHSDRSASGREQARYLGVVRVAQLGRVVGAAAVGVDPRPFKMDAGDDACLVEVGEHGDRLESRQPFPASL